MRSPATQAHLNLEALLLRDAVNLDGPYTLRLRSMNPTPKTLNP